MSNIQKHKNRINLRTVVKDVWFLFIYSYPHNRPWRPRGLWDVKDLTLSRQSAHS
jgi:hypothetical protein